MIEIKARDTTTREELVLLDLPAEYMPEIGQIVKTTNGMYTVQSFVEVDLSPFTSVGESSLKKKILLLSLERLD